MIQEYDEFDVRNFVKNRHIRDRVGKALSRAYPKAEWGVTVEGGVVQFWCPQISTNYGMVIHHRHTNEDIETIAVRKAGELLERFNVSRTVSNFDHIRCNARGEALNAAKGEL